MEDLEEIKEILGKITVILLSIDSRIGKNIDIEKEPSTGKDDIIRHYRELIVTACDLKKTIYSFNNYKHEFEISQLTNKIMKLERERDEQIEKLKKPKKKPVKIKKDKTS